jgi:HemY protein
VQDAARLNATRWALHDRDERSAHQYLSQLPQGTARRTLALRLRLKADRMGQMHLPALDTARLLAKHGAFSPNAANSLMRGLALASIDDCRDAHQLQATWRILQSAERAMPEVAVHAARRLLGFNGEANLALQWLLPVWQALSSNTAEWSDSAVRQRVVEVLAHALQTLAPDSEWLARVEQSRLANPRSVELQYLSGMVCLRHSLWGKAQQLLEQAAPRLQSSDLKRSAWRALAELAEQKGDQAQALACWKLSAVLELKSYVAGRFSSNGIAICRKSRLVSTSTKGPSSITIGAGRSRGTCMGLGSAAMAAFTCAMRSGLEFTHSKPLPEATCCSFPMGSS